MSQKSITVSVNIWISKGASHVFREDLENAVKVHHQANLIASEATDRNGVRFWMITEFQEPTSEDVVCVYVPQVATEREKTVSLYLPEDEEEA